jgi:hypothetical protein
VFSKVQLILLGIGIAVLVFFAALKIKSILADGLGGQTRFLERVQRDKGENKKLYPKPIARPSATPKIIVNNTPNNKTAINELEDVVPVERDPELAGIKRAPASQQELYQATRDYWLHKSPKQGLAGLEDLGVAPYADKYMEVLLRRAEEGNLWEMAEVGLSYVMGSEASLTRFHSPKYRLDYTKRIDCINQFMFWTKRAANSGDKKSKLRFALANLSQQRAYINPKTKERVLYEGDFKSNFDQRSMPYYDKNWDAINMFDGVNTDPKLGIDYLKKAAGDGSLQAAEILKRFYNEGVVVNKDPLMVEKVEQDISKKLFIRYDMQ